MHSPIRMGILGCAQITKAALLDAAIGAGIDVTAVASRAPARSEAYAREHGIETAYESYEELIADPLIDAIYNPLPNSMHAAWTIRAHEAGKDVLCEKPIASNATEARRMADVAQSTGRRLMEAFHYRHHPMMRQILETVRGGAIGQIRRVETRLEIPGSLLQPDNIRFQFALAGGALMDVGSYCMNAVRAVTREEPLFTRATATLAQDDVDGAMAAEMTFPSGVQATLSCSLTAPALRAELRIIGAEGKMVANNPFLPQLGHGLETTIGGSTTSQSFDMTPTYVFQARAFAAFLRTGAAPLTSMDDAIANMAAIDACYLAAGLRGRGLG